MLLTSIFLPTVIVVIHSILNTVSLYYNTINTVPFHAVVQLLALWVFISVPLSIVGTLFGRNGKNLMGGPDSGTIARRANDFPCRVNSIPRPIPSSLGELLCSNEVYLLNMRSICLCFFFELTAFPLPVFYTLAKIIC